MDFWTYPREVDEEFAERVRSLLDEIYPPKDRPHRFDVRFDREVYRKLKVWQREHLDGAGPRQVAAFRREIERAGLSVRERESTDMIAKVIEAAGSESQKNEYLGGYRNGTMQFAMGYTEPDSGSDVAAAKTRAVRDGDMWIINGQKMFTSNADVYTHVFLLTRTDVDAPKHDGLTMFLVPLDAEGVEIQPIETLGHHHTNMTFYTDVEVPDSARIGGVDEGWGVMRLALNIEHGAGPKRARRNPDAVDVRLDESPPALGVNAGRWPDIPPSARSVSAGDSASTIDVLNATVAWASATRRPDGSTVFDDPVVRGRLGRIAVEAEVCRLIERRNDRARFQPGVGNGTKLSWSELFQRATSTCLDIVGPRGLLPHSEPGSLADGGIDMAFRSAIVGTIVGGCSEVQLDIIAERRLGLPKSRPRGPGRSD
jgi:hypothetical protein